MEAKIEKKTRNRHPDTVSLDPDILEKIDAEIVQVIGNKRGIRLTRRDYVAYRLRKSPPKVPADELEELISIFYDEERFLKEALREVREAKARGEKISVTYTGSPTKEKRVRKTSIIKTEKLNSTSQLVDDEKPRESESC